MTMKLKKGFTLVELVIVIAVIVILAAVLIPTFSGVIKKANNAKDFSYVTNMNEILELEEITNGKNETMYDAAGDLEKYGMDIEKLPSSKGYIYVWNSKENRVAALDKDYKLVFPQGEEINDSNKENYFAVAKTEEEINNLYSLGYSVYLKESATVTTVNATQGFDAGKNTKVTAVNYTGGATAKSVITRTNLPLDNKGKIKDITLTINAENDSVSHYGEATEVVVTAVANESYHEFGKVTTLKVTKGHILAENGAKIGDLVVTSEASSVKITNENKGSIENFVVETETNKDVNITYNGKSGSLEEIKSDIAKDTNIIVLGDENEVNMVSSVEEIQKILKYKKPVAITLANSLKLSSALSISSKVFIDLNGFTLSSTAMNTLKLNADADVTVSSSKESGMITNEYSGRAAATTIYLVGNGSVFTLESGTVQSNAKDHLQSLAICSYVNNKPKCTVNINGGIVCNPNGHENSRAISVSKNMTININDGKIDGGLYALDTYEGSVSNINGGELWANAKDGRTDEYGTSYAIHAKGEATINIGSKDVNTISNVKGIKFEANGPVTALPTITLVKGNITNPVYSMEAKYNYSLFKLGIEADAQVTFTDNTASFFLPDGLEMVQDGNVWKVKATSAE